MKPEFILLSLVATTIICALFKLAAPKISNLSLFLIAPAMLVIFTLGLVMSTQQEPLANPRNLKVMPSVPLEPFQGGYLYVLWGGIASIIIGMVVYGIKKSKKLPILIDDKKYLKICLAVGFIVSVIHLLLTSYNHLTPFLIGYFLLSLSSFGVYLWTRLAPEKMRQGIFVCIFALLLAVLSLDIAKAYLRVKYPACCPVALKGLAIDLSLTQLDVRHLQTFFFKNNPPCLCYGDGVYFPRGTQENEKKN